MDKRFLIWSLGFAVMGLSLGIYMAASNNHGELVTHAHILLIGFLLSFVYSLIHRLWLVNPARGIATIQFVVHQAAAATLAVSLFLLFAGVLPLARLEPILGLASISVLFSMVLMIYMIIRFGTGKPAEAG
ncbi:MAG: TonB-dependent receptor [Proteobacteria bacterium]|nr:TonB-dependent receptor [Pseudomonadota bacterium]